jgi:O-antigen ligase
MEMILTKRATEYFMDRERVIRHIDTLIFFSFCVLVIFLPIAHTETVRAFAFAIPAGLWIIKMILTRRFLFTRTFLDLPILLFTIVAGLSIFTAVDPKYSLGEFIGEWVKGVFLFYLVVNNIRPEKMKYILGALLAGNLLMVGYGIFDFLKSDASLLDYHWRSGSLHSGYGTFSTYLITILPYIVTAFFSLVTFKIRLLLGFLLLLNFFALFITYSRGAWLALAVLLAMAGWKFLSKRIFILSTSLVVIGILFLAPKGIFIHQTQILRSDGTQAELETSKARWQLTKFTIQKIWENPFRMLGFGRRSFVKAYREFYLKYKGALLWHTHNTFLDFAIQTGIQGLILFLFLLYRLLRYCYQNPELEEDRIRRFYFQATFFMIITFFVRNLSDDFFVDDSALLFWFLSGILFANKINN